MSCISACGIKLFEEQMTLLGVPKLCQYVASLHRVTMLAALIISCIAWAGGLPVTTAGWCVLGLTAAGFVFLAAPGKFKERKFSLILSGLIAAACSVMGVLGGIGVISAPVMGGAVVGIFSADLCLAVFMVVGTICHCTGKHNRQEIIDPFSV